MDDATDAHRVQLVLVANQHVIIRQALDILQQRLLGDLLLIKQYFHVRSVAIGSLEGAATFGLGRRREESFNAVEKTS